MRTIALLTMCLLLIMSVFAVAQEAPKAEVFGGYQLLHANTGTNFLNSFNMNGWDAAVNGYFSHYIGVTGDFSGTYGTPKVAGIGVSTHAYTYMFGPVVRATNSSAFTPFAHVLFGGGHFNGSVNSGGVSGSKSDSSFAWAGGGGVDVKASRYLSIRVAQFDFLQTRFFSDTQNNFRYSAGVVLRF